MCDLPAATGSEAPGHGESRAAKTPARHTGPVSGALALKRRHHLSTQTQCALVFKYMNGEAPSREYDNAGL